MFAVLVGNFVLPILALAVAFALERRARSKVQLINEDEKDQMVLQQQIHRECGVRLAHMFFLCPERSALYVRFRAKSE